MDPADYPGIRQVSHQSSPPMDPAEYPADGTLRLARQWIPASIPPELLASESRRVSRQSRRVPHQSSPPVDAAKHPAEYPRVARQWISPSIPLSIPCWWMLQYPASIELERLASIRQWIPPVCRQSSSPVWFCLMSCPAHSWVYISCWCLRVLSVP